MAERKRRVTTTAELYETAMSNTGGPPTDGDAVELRRRQAQLTHLALHRHIRAKPDGLLEFVKGIIDLNDMVWTFWEDGDGRCRWDLIKGRTMLEAGALQGSEGLGRYREATVLVPDQLASQLLLASYGEGREIPNRFGVRGAVLSISHPSERKRPSGYALIAATEPL